VLGIDGIAIESVDALHRVLDESRIQRDCALKTPARPRPRRRRCSSPCGRASGRLTQPMSRRVGGAPSNYVLPYTDLTLTNSRMPKRAHSRPNPNA
jgi:hypothetical protein